MNARETALELLNRWPESELLADELLEYSLAESTLGGSDRAFVTELFYGCLRRRLSLDFLLAQLATKAPRPIVANVLVLGFYQLFYLKTPAHAAVNESVALAKRYGGVAEAKFVNAVLRRAQRESDALLTKLGDTRPSEPWIYYSHPEWLWKRWAVRLGDEPTAALCDWNNQPPPLYIRINTLKHSPSCEGLPPSRAVAASAGEGPTAHDSRPTVSHPDRMMETARSADLRRTPNPSPQAGTPVPPEDVQAEPTDHALCWRVTETAGLFRTKSFVNGEFYVQDPSTLVAVDVLDPQPGDAVLDMCAAPGGKTTYIAQKMQNRGRIIAADSQSSRLALVGENCRRLGVQIVATLACEGTRLDRCLRGEEFDRVLVDAPCSNTGVLRRRADLRWRLSEEEIGRLAGLQGRLIAAAAKFTKRGGVLVYSTCSLESEENEGVVKTFLAAHKEFTVETTRSLFPPRDGVDGAFVARFRRTNPSIQTA